MAKAKKITTAVLGSFVEWYDIALVGALSKYINHNFFDECDPMTSLVNIFLMFAVGYLARPLGALFFGYYGDHYGRQTALRLSLILVSSATLFIACLPTIHEVGILATASLVVLRFIQGFGSGGEHAGGILLLYEGEGEQEHEHQSKRANYAIIAIMCGLFFGFASAWLVKLFFDEQAMNEWAWRLPFLLGAFLGLFGVVLRMNNVREIPVERTLSGMGHYKRFFIQNKKPFLIASGIYIHSVAIFYTNYFFYPTYMEQHQWITSATINEVRVVMSVVFLALFVFLAQYLNGCNEQRWLKMALVSTALFIFPLHYAMMNYGLYGYCVSMAALTVLNVMYLLPIAGLISGLFARRYRYTGVSLAINIVSSLFGGTAPLMLTFLVSYFDHFLAGGMYLFMTATIGYVSVSWLGKTSKEGVVYVS